MPAEANPNPALPGVHACVFDAYGTLFDVNSPAERLRETLGDKADALSAVWRAKQLEYTWLRSLMGVHADFWQVTGEALDFALEDTGLADARLREDLMAHYLHLDAYPDAAPTLDLLRAGGRGTAILSNGAPAMLRAGAESAALAPRLDDILSVEDAGVYKPHPTVYQLAVDRFSLPREAICFVSSNGWDVAGAASFGFQVVWLNRAGRTRERLPAGPNAEVRGLDALPGLIGL